MEHHMTSPQVLRTGILPRAGERPTATPFGPLPLSPVDRALLAILAPIARRRLVGVYGLADGLLDRDPFILALNHSTRLEALSVPVVLMAMRGGHRIHFLADWNFRLLPGVGFLYRRAGVVTVANKPARPRILDRLRPLYREPHAPLELARRHLLAGRPIGLFTEGTVNRDPERLRRGRLGAARLSLETGVGVLPAGLRFPDVPPGMPVPEGAAFEIHFGSALVPASPAGGDVSSTCVREWHGRIMTAIGRLSGKSWQPWHEEKSDEHRATHFRAQDHDRIEPPQGTRGTRSNVSGREGLGP